ncbi:putative heterokaryon incompatibility [Septoria linicola]|nr:putative heterokaryon incompatibility [Septoria linicola]
MSCLTSSTDLYQYPTTPLRWPAFRVLRLLKGRLGTPVHCELLEATPEENYEALSYTWGSDERVEGITVDKKHLWITDNLFAALQNPRSNEEDRVPWIDGICIDQDNIDEKSGQVQHMASVYGQAWRVIIWLGKATRDVSILMQSLIGVKDMAVAFPVEARGAHMLCELGTLKANSSATSHVTRGLQVLLRRPWFSRVWILQEVANAQGAIVCSGAYAVDVYIFATAASIFCNTASRQISACFEVDA